MDLTGGSVTNLPILYDNFFNHVASATLCGLTLNGAQYQMDTDAGCTTAQALDVAIHSYIMGFQFNPVATSTDPNFIAASIIWPGLTTTDYLTVGKSTPATPEAITITYAAAGLAAGPQVTLNNYGGQLQTIKVAFVFTVINSQASALGMGVGSLFEYSYSGIYQQIAASTYGIQSILTTNGADYNTLLT